MRERGRERNGEEKKETKTQTERLERKINNTSVTLPN